MCEYASNVLLFLHKLFVSVLNLSLACQGFFVEINQQEQEIISLLAESFVLVLQGGLGRDAVGQSA